MRGSQIYTMGPAVALTFDVWSQKLISTSAKPNNYVCDQNWATHSLWDMVFTLLFGSLPAVTLNFKFLTSTSNQHICEPEYICDHNLVKFLSYGVHEAFGSLPAVAFVFDLLIPKSNQHIHEPKYIYVQNWAKFPSLVFEIWCSQGFRDAQTRRLTHSRTDRPQYRMLPAAFFNAGGSIK